MPAVFARLPIDPAASAALRAGVPAAGAAAESVPASQWITALVPANAMRAAADGAIVPVLVFTVAFALGLRRVARALRDPLVDLFKAVDAAITVLLHWIVGLSPYGVFALGLGLAVRVGAGIVTALAYYVVVSSAAMVAVTAALYVAVWIGAGVPPGRFARAAAPAQVVAFGTHSSMASLPAMLEGAEQRLGLSKTATGFVLPMSLAVFKYSGPVWFVVVTFFIGRLYDVAIDPSRVLAVVVAAVVTSFAIGGVPSGAAVVVAPVLAAAGLPVEAMGVLLAVDPIPNAFRTVANVTGMLAVTVLADGRRGAADGVLRA
jgi:Na+/H+-dicarboxylate symporter